MYSIERNTMKHASFARVVRFQLPIWLVAPMLGVALLLGVGWGYAGAWLSFPPATCPESHQVCEQFTLYWKVWELASENFVDEEAIVPETMIEGSINGMLDSLGDRGHTRFLPAEAARKWDESLSGEFEGIGAYLDMRNGQGYVVAPIDGSPADKAGLRAGDLIIEVDGQPTMGWTIEELVAQIRGPEGSTVTLTIQHVDEEETVDIVIERDRIEVPSVSWRMLPNDVAFVRLTTFARRSAEEMQQALTEAKQEGARMVIFDLRNNQGGYVHEAIGIASQFLPEGTTVLLEEDREGNRTAEKAHEGGVALDIPVVVLINYNTASSSEIVSGALQDTGRAELVGTRTVGTGTVLTTYKLEGGARLLLGTVQWLTPHGRLIRKQGIEPDVEVSLPVGSRILSPAEATELSEEELLNSEDVQLVRAFEVVQKLTTRK
jgi:carboxyl-terminal processing protease